MTTPNIIDSGAVRWYEHAGLSVHSAFPGGAGTGRLGCGGPLFWSVGSVSADCTVSGVQPFEATGIHHISNDLGFAMSFWPHIQAFHCRFVL